jgi:hypothetical protein
MRRLMILICLVITPLAHAQLIEPEARYLPEEVVQLVLTAMQTNDAPYPNAGVEQAFYFASPKNKRATGPLWHFTAIVTQPQYAPLLNHRSRQIGQPERSDDGMTVPVIVIGEQGQVAGYLWRLSRQTDAPFDGFWMTDAVIPVELDQSMRGL